MALESFPPFVLVSVRFCISGGLLLLFAWWRGMHIPRGRDLVRTGLFGVMILGAGNVCLTVAEQWIPSSLAALFIAPSPFWMVGLEAALPEGERLRGSTIVGMLIGFAGTALLVAPDLMASGFSGDIWRGFLLLQIGSASWSFGSVLQRRHKTQSHPVVSGAVQQLAAGLAFALPALVVKSQPAVWSGRGLWALVYLIVFGSIVGYSSYVYALSRLSVALVSIYTYINPIVAAILGWLFYREPFGRHESLALALVLVGVAVVKHFAPRERAGVRYPSATTAPLPSRQSPTAK